MRFYADLHIHSKYSRACSKNCDLEHLTWWAKRKGISLVGTGDVTHPAWFAHLQENLVPAEPGLFRLRPDLERDIDRSLPPSCATDARFMLSVEISTIYKRDERTRKIHHLIYLPDFEAAEAFNRRLGAIGNIGSDGRPILGLDSRDLLEIALECSPDAYLVPAHIWTPWFSVLGSKAGFDAVEDCYLDLADHIFALETGLSADPEMIWRVSALDRYRLVSYSDAHSPPMLGREASRFDTDLDYYAVRRALQTGEGYRGSVEFFPEEGKYHLDGHRKCQVRLDPADSRALDSRCPECGKPLTLGVLHRVHELSDRTEGARPEGAAGFQNLIPLPEIMGEILGVGPKSKKVSGEIASLTAAYGPELTILDETPTDDLEQVVPHLGEAVGRLRRGEVIREAGYDGEYGTIRLFQPGELDRLRATQAPALFDDGLGAGDAVAARPSPRAERAREKDVRARSTTRTGPETEAALVAPADVSAADELLDEESTGSTLLAGLDPAQREAAAAGGGPLLIIAGPGTGKTRTLTHRIAHLLTEQGVPARQCLAITFTRRAAKEMTDRLHGLVGRESAALTVTTFHSFGLSIVREQHWRFGLSADFGVADAERQLEILAEALGDGRAARRMLPDISRARRDGEADDAEVAKAMESYLRRLREADLADFDDLVALPVAALESDPELAAVYRDRYRWISVDEYQDIDAVQYRLLRMLAPPEANLTVIGDPDQAIYRFRGSDVGFFLRFHADYPSARVVHLTRNYRSGAHILTAAMRAVEPTTLVADRVLVPADRRAEAVKIGVHEASNEHAEAGFITRTIDQLLGGSSFHSLDTERASAEATEGIGFSDIAVLYRTSAQARPIVDALTRADYPFQRHSHDRLIDRAGVREILDEFGYASPASKAPDVRAGLQRAAEIVLNRAPHAGQEGRAAELYSAVELLTPLAVECGSNVERFRHELLLGAEVDALDPRAERISLLTLHAAKGLEFPVVFLAGCEEGLLPLRWPGTELDDAELAEERRLFFVGMTRAQRLLFVTGARERTWQGQQRDCKPSSFLQALDSSVSERVGAEDNRRTPRSRQLTLI
ncbi:AAA family ATPase [Actinobacteria bacterium YIM 96077]|uniref:DNA 3'-5' helicase n=1 Tax=Phytoactinopolyspora halophila TaxID=1981511 RepID=A0A329QZU7_9ACTN|nr:UvrD-helicase domain-containing protein [Phytoactinopolyspora halophila]AYY11697.1 AAA family ATPase [Actinobacteria bacterium YIM 96077]RAW17870.1 AAA family ATPase [Phytoactinopolyspora halophila]